MMSEPEKLFTTESTVENSKMNLRGEILLFVVFGGPGVTERYVASH
jgi:hypothetical protein